MVILLHLLPSLETLAGTLNSVTNLYIQRAGGLPRLLFIEFSPLPKEVTVFFVKIVSFLTFELVLIKVIL